MSDLTRAEVEQYSNLALCGPHSDAALIRLRIVCASWLVLEAKMREQESQIARYQNYLKWQGEIHVEDRKEIHELRAKLQTKETTTP